MVIQTSVVAKSEDGHRGDCCFYAQHLPSLLLVRTSQFSLGMGSGWDPPTYDIYLGHVMRPWPKLTAHPSFHPSVHYKDDPVSQFGPMGIRPVIFVR